MKIIVLTNCTAKKGTKPARAEALYLGEQHVRLMRGVRAARERGHDVQVWIISARHGLVSGDRVIEPYDESFSEMRACVRKERYRQFGLDAAVRGLLRDYDMAIICLGELYAEPIGFRRYVYTAPTVRYVGTPAPPRRFYQEIAADNDKARETGCGVVGLKGELAARLLDTI
jgi:hypothetical protein